MHSGGARKCAQRPQPAQSEFVWGPAAGWFVRSPIKALFCRRRRRASGAFEGLSALKPVFDSPYACAVRQLGPRERKERQSIPRGHVKRWQPVCVALRRARRGAGCRAPPLCPGRGADAATARRARRASAARARRVRPGPRKAERRQARALRRRERGAARGARGRRRARVRRSGAPRRGLAAAACRGGPLRRAGAHAGRDHRADGLLPRRGLRAAARAGGASLRAELPRAQPGRRNHAGKGACQGRPAAPAQRRGFWRRSRRVPALRRCAALRCARSAVR